MTDFATINAGHKAYERDKRDCRQFAVANRAQLQAEWGAMPDVPRTIDQHLARCQ